MLTCAMDQVGKDKKLLATARDCFYFVTKFFEPINISAAHIYHSALELSPLSSIVRSSYHHLQHSPLPRVIAGISNSWDPRVTISGSQEYTESAWSPCGQFIAALSKVAVEIRDPLSLELLSTLTKSDAHLIPNGLAYSPDGHSLACLSSTALVIWDIQTGGVAKEIRHGGVGNGSSLVWSLDGRMIGTVEGLIVCIYNITSGARWSPGTLQSCGDLHLWAHNTSFQAATM